MQRKRFANAARSVFVNKYREIRAAGFTRATYIWMVYSLVASSAINSRCFQLLYPLFCPIKSLHRPREPEVKNCMHTTQSTKSFRPFWKSTVLLLAAGVEGWQFSEIRFLSNFLAYNFGLLRNCKSVSLVRNYTTKASPEPSWRSFSIWIDIASKRGNHSRKLDSSSFAEWNHSAHSCPSFVFSSSWKRSGFSKFQARTTN